MKVQDKVKSSIAKATLMAEKLQSLINTSLSDEEISAISEMNNKLIVIVADMSILIDSENPDEEEVSRLSTLCDQLYSIISSL